MRNGDLSEFDLLVSLARGKSAPFSPAQRVLLRAQCERNAKKRIAGTLDAKAEDKALVAALKRAEGLPNSKNPRPQTNIRNRGQGYFIISK